MGPIRSCLAAIGAAIIYTLIWLFGKRVRRDAVAWLDGPTGGPHIGDRPYEECAAREGLTMRRHADRGGLIPDFTVLGGPSLDVAEAHPEIRRFYEQTARYRMDIWAKSAFPANIALWLLVTTISRKVDQLNFPVDALDTAAGVESEIVLLENPDGSVRYTGWFRRLRRSRRVLYTGFYMTEQAPLVAARCVKVVFPMPDGNATVILRPSLDADGAFILDSSGRGFGDAGFYRIQASGPEHLRVWRVHSLKERFRLFVDEEGTLRCDHTVRFLGMPVVHLHYRMERADGASHDGAASAAH